MLSKSILYQGRFRGKEVRNQEGKKEGRRQHRQRIRENRVIGLF